MTMSKTYLVTKDDLRAELLKLMREGVDLNPIGTVISFMGQQPPVTYLPCDGHQYVIEDYQELAEFITVQFGTVNYFGGDGERYFAVPSLGGEFLRGAGTNTHTRSGNGAAVGVHQEATSLPHIGIDPSHSQMYLPNIGGQAMSAYWGNNSDKTFDLTAYGRVYNGTETTNATIKFSTTYTQDMSNQALVTTRPTNTSVLFCIKAKTGDEQ